MDKRMGEGRIMGEGEDGMDKRIGERITALLLESDALRIAPEDRPFWYTSATIGPFYNNTQFLFGGEARANELLALIDDAAAAKTGRLGAQGAISARILAEYGEGGLFRKAADCMAEYMRARIDMDGIDIISGGERRDWIFSIIAAHLFRKPHLAIFKDMSAALGGAPVAPGSLAGKRCLHVSDLVTEASSYTRAWAPAVAAAGARLTDSLTVVDRAQGGGAALAALGIRHHALVSMTPELFDRLLSEGRINGRQRELIRRYMQDPRGAMRAFVMAHPEFVESALRSGGKDAERARECVAKGIYA
ncbi:MAG: orotate phosphoribosyltransferase [Clostridiales bacterium]|nr:orotate phosphoribosyltransferase [Clostridiales bacterium]